MHRFNWIVAAALSFVLFISAASAATGAPAESGHVAWVLTASALVLFMTLPGLALFYGGLVQAKNLLSVIMQCFAICCVVSLIWAICGYSLTFGGTGAVLGNFSKSFLAGLDPAVAPSNLPEIVVAVFQMTFAIITPALIIGAFPERVTFPFVLAFTALWLIIVYIPVAHWVWGAGWLASLGTLDFAGGIVVHTTAGVSALVAAILIGKRRGFPAHFEPPHRPGMTMAGAGMLWVGWFGFNGGSALAADAGAASAIMSTHLAACAGALAWIAIEWVRSGKPTCIGIVTGCVAGLATITPAAGYVHPASAILIGALGGTICFFATVHVKQRLVIDDSLDVFAVHGVGGMLGSVLMSVFAAAALGGVGFADGMNFPRQLGAQVLAILVTALWSAGVTFTLVCGLRAVTGLRVDAEQEFDGLDFSTHGERAYDYAG
ncbi:MAG: ammonium transporter [Methylobacteriaceae bacterium]|nr:ammonium transporter [Methylobacteriaceae bacterium]